MTFRTVVAGGTGQEATEATEDVAAEEEVVAEERGTGTGVTSLRLASPLLSARSVASFADAPTLTGFSASRLAATLPAAVRDLRLAVHPAQVDDAAVGTTANVFGEVELTFRTED
jgi:predicted O-methyltransferase YrrM